MTILAGDIKLVKSQVMLDTPEGGGAPTDEVIEDAVSNSIFPDISELDRAGGRVNLMKIHATVQTPTTDGYYGANMIVAEPPQDPNVSITLFTTDSTFDRRDDAKSRLESYLAYGAPYSGFLFGNHLAGQMTITILAGTEIALPVVGTTLVLVKNESLTTEVSQFVRITSVSSSERNFEDDKGIYARQEITIGISDTLRYDFAGFDASRYFPTESQMQTKTRVRSTVVANAARYYGVSPLAEAVSLGDYTIRAESIFTNLVPSAQVETPIADARMNQQSAALVAAGNALTISPTQIFDTTHTMFVGGGILPGSLSVVRDTITVVDSGGALLNAATLAQVGTVDYSNGLLSLTSSIWGSGGGTHTVVFTPASAPVVVSKTFGLPVTVASQRLTWVTTLEALPAKRSLQISYRAQGRWYVLSEDGSGAIRGTDSAYGIGSLNYSTGTISLTLGALPDVGSQILYAWAPAVSSPKLSTIPAISNMAALSNKLHARFELGAAIKPGTLTITWNDGSAKTAADSGGTLTGNANGVVDYSGGVIYFAPTTLPAVGTAITINITEATGSTQSVTSFTDSGSTWAVGISGPIRAGSFSAGLRVTYPASTTASADTASAVMTVYDNGSGALVMPHVSGTINIGTINYSTGVLSIAKSIASVPMRLPVYRKTTIVPSYELYSAGGGPVGAQYFIGESYEFAGYDTASVTVNVPTATTGQPFSVKVATTSDVGAQTFNSSLTELRLNGSPSRFHVGSDVYTTSIESVDVVRNPSTSTGVGTVAGAVLNRTVVSASATTASGTTAISQWPTGASSTLTYSAGTGNPALSGNTTLTVDCAMFRTAVAPLRNGSFSVAGTWPDGATFTASSDSAGKISTGSAAGASTPGSYGVFGLVDYDSGVVQLRFGRRVPDAWASEANVIDLSYLQISGVKYVQSQGAQADTLRYNASAYTYLPLDADILGIDPVRLPSDGRVPIFRAGDFAVLGHSAEVGPITVSNGQTVNCGRVRLSRVRVIGNDGLVINSGYSANLEAGTVTFSSVTGYSQPVKIEHRIEDMMLVRDAQISGDLSFTRPVTHDYPIGSYVSSALVAGDLVARVSLLFDQASWTNVWSDVLIGSNATGTYNDVLSPIEVTNVGALTERWAIRFTNTNAFEVIGEHVGVIATGNTSADISPTNPATGQPYFTIRAIGWGGGWTIGNALRFNTVGCQFPVWVVRTVQQGPETVINDSFTLLTRGDVDRP